MSASGDATHPQPDDAAGRAHADRIAQLLDLEPLTHEGGRFRRTLADGHGTAIYYLLADDDASALHRLASTEVWHHYAGAPVRLLTLHPDGTAEEQRLGDDLLTGERPQIIVPVGVWQGAVSLGAYSLVGTTMAPPYTQEGFELGDPAELARRYPDAAELIALITERSGHLFGDPPS